MEAAERGLLPPIAGDHAPPRSGDGASLLATLETIGRLALRGLWLVWADNAAGSVPRLVEDGDHAEAIDAFAAGSMARRGIEPAIFAAYAVFFGRLARIAERAPDDFSGFFTAYGPYGRPAPDNPTAAG